MSEKAAGSKPFNPRDYDDRFEYATPEYSAGGRHIVFWLIAVCLIYVLLMVMVYLCGYSQGRHRGVTEACERIEGSLVELRKSAYVLGYTQAIQNTLKPPASEPKAIEFPTALDDKAEWTTGEVKDKDPKKNLIEQELFLRNRHTEVIPARTK